MPFAPPEAARDRQGSFTADVRRRTARLVGAIAGGGLVLVIGLWAAVLILIASERRMAMEHGEIDASNLSAAFQEEVGLELNGVLHAMDMVTQHIARDPASAFTLYDWADHLATVAVPTFQIAFTGPDGILLSSTIGPLAGRIDLSDREHIHVPLDSNWRGLFISKPVIESVSHRPAIQFSRRVDTPDGRIVGVLVFSLSPLKLTRLHRTVDVGPGGMLVLFGTDGIIRARFTAADPDGSAGVGQMVAHLDARDALDETHDLRTVLVGPEDRITRIISERRIVGYPLFVGVGLDVDEVLGPASAHGRQIVGTAIYATMLLTVLLAALAGEVRRRARNEMQLAMERSALAADIALRQHMEQQLRESEQKFQDIAEASGDIIWQTDAEHRFVLLVDKEVMERAGIPSAAILGKRRWEVATADPVQDEKWCLHKADLDAHRPFRMFRYAAPLPTGEIRYLAVSGKPFFDVNGVFLGYRGTATDETPTMVARQHAEQAESLLRDAVDSLSEGFVIYDKDDRLVLCNEAYRRINQVNAHLIMPGVTCETLIRNAVASEYYSDAIGHEEEWIANYLNLHREPGRDLETHLRNGRWILVAERRMRNGGIAGLCVDITEIKRTQEALRESERRLREFAEMASDWFWEQDADLRITWVSEGPVSRGLGPKQSIGKARWEVYPDGTTPEKWEVHKAELLATRPFRDFRYHRPDRFGGERYVSIHGSPIFDPNGVFVGYRGVGRDITEQIEAEQELERARQRAEQAESLLRDAVESISEGFVISDRDDYVVMHNEAYRQIYADSPQILVPHQRFEDILRRDAASGTNLSARGREAEWITYRLSRHRDATGSVESQRANGRWYLATERRMKSGGIAGLRIDITALKQTQAALRESEERLDRAQAIAGIGSWELDATSGQYLMSKELRRIVGLTPDFVPTRESIAPLIHPDDLPAARSWLNHLLRTGEAGSTEMRIIRPRGDVRALQVEGRPIRDSEGTISRIAGTVQDVTERRLIEQQLVQAQKMEAIGNLTGGLAHDFNNLLGVIMGNLDLLRRGVNNNPIAAELCDEALAGAARGSDLIRRLLAFARRQALHPARIDVNALVQDVARLLGRMLGEDITLSLDLNPSSQPVTADPAQLESALVNFATNARDAMPKGGRLAIATRNVVLDATYAATHHEVVPGLYVAIEVTDSGTGIPPEIIDHIFEPFFTTKTQGRGTGLGLSMAFGFARQSGGQLTVYSELGRGTTFRLYLPAGADAVATHDERLVPDEVTGGDETVLMVEDHIPLRQAAVRQLTVLGYRVVEAEDADAALAMLSQGVSADLLFTDVVMPGTMDGLDLAQRAREMRPGLKVLLTSGFAGVRGADRRAADTPFPLLGKPYRHDDLARAVRQALGDTGYSSDAAARQIFAAAEEDAYKAAPAEEGERH